MGYLTLMDWKSLELAGVGNSKVLKQTIIDTAVALGKIKEGQITIGTFSSTLKDKWADQEVIEKSFAKYAEFSQAVYKEMEEHPDLYEDTADAIEKMSKQYNELGVTSFRAAQECKTFGETIDYTKDAIGSQFSEIFKAIFGNYTQAKVLWSDFANDFLYPLFVQPIEKLKEKVQAIMSFNPFSALLDKLEDSKIGQFSKKVHNLTKSLEYYQTMVTSVWRGDWKNQPYRKGLEEAAGHNYSVIQSLVNKGYLYKLTVEDCAEAEKKFGVGVEEVTQQVEELSDEMLKNAGFTDDEIKLYKELEKQSKKTGKSISELIEEMSGKDGRTLLIESFYNFGKSFLSILQSIGKAWSETFGGPSLMSVWNALNSFNKFSEAIKNSVTDADNVDKLVRTLKGLFSILHIITSFIGGGFKLAFNIIKGVLGAFDLNILDVTAKIGDMIVALDHWLTQNNLIIRTAKFLAPLIADLTKAIGDWAASNEILQNGLKKIKSILDSVGKSIDNWFKGLGQAENVPKYIFEGLINGLTSGVKNVIEVVTNFAKMIIETVCKVLGIESPSKVFFAIGGFIIAGLILGITDALPKLWNLLGSFGTGIADFFKNFDWGLIIAGGIGIGLTVVGKKIIDTVDRFAGIAEAVVAPLKGIGSMFTNIGVAINNVSQAFNKKAMGEMIMNIAKGILMLAAALFVISLIKPERLWSSIGALATLAAILAAMSGIMYALSKASEGLKGGFSVIKMIGAMVGIGAALILMAASLKILSTISWEQIGPALVGLVGVVVGLGALIIAISKIDFMLAKNIDKVGKMIRKLATTLLLMVLVFKLAGTINNNDVVRSIEMMASFGVFAAAMVAVSHFAGEHADKAGKMIRKLATALLIMVATFKLAGLLNDNDIEKGRSVLITFGIFCTALTAVSRLAGDAASKAGSMILKISIALGILIGVIKLISYLKDDEIKKGLRTIGALELFMAGLIAVSKLSGQFSSRAGAMLISAAIACGILAGVIYILTKIDTDEGYWAAVGTVAILEVLMGGLIGVSHFSGNANLKALKMIVAGVVLLAAALIALTFLDQSKLQSSAIALGGVMLTLAALMVAMNFFAKNTNNVGGTLKTIAPMLIIVGALAGIVALLSMLPSADRSIQSAISLSILATALVGLTAILSKMKFDRTNVATGIIALTGLAIPLAAFMGILNGMSGVQNSVKNVIALSLMAAACTGLIAVFSKIANVKDAGNIAVGIIALTGMAIPLLAFTGVLALMSGIENATKNTLALVGLAAAMTLLLIPLTILGALCIGTGGIGIGAIAIGVASLAAMALPLLAFVGVLSLMSGIQNATENSKLLTIMMETFTECLIKLALVSPLLLVADAALAGLLIVIGAFGAFAVGVGALMEKYPQLEQFLNKGMPILAKISGGIGQILGELAGGFIEGVGNHLPAIGESLSDFAEKAGPFFDRMNAMDEKTGNGIKALAAGILCLTGASFIQGVTAFLPFVKDFGEMGKSLTEFYLNATPFLIGMSTIPENTFVGIKNFADGILALTAANLLNGISSFLSFGTSNLETFGQQLPALGTCLKEFIANLGPFGEEQVTATDCAGRAIKALGESAKEIPKTDGLWQMIVGEQSLAKFGADLPDLGTRLKEFVTNLGTFGEEQVTTVDCAGRAIKALAESAKELPNQDGLWQAIFGEQSLATFGDQLPKLGKGLNEFITNLGSFNESNIETVKTACSAIDTLANTAKNLPKEGGFWQKLFGEQSLSTFAGHLPPLGEKLSEFMSKIRGLSTSQIDSVNAATAIIMAIADLGKIDVGKVSGKLEGLGKNMNKFGDQLKTFCNDKIGQIGYEGIKQAIDKCKDLIDLMMYIGTQDLNSVNKFGDDLVNVGENGVKKFVETFTNLNAKFHVNEKLTELINFIKDGIENRKYEVKNAFKHMIEFAIDGLNEGNTANKAYNAGVNFVQGFANGINNNAGTANRAAYNLGAKASQNLNAGIDAHSPSKITTKSGQWFGQGFINGIISLSSKVYDSAYGMGDKARNGLNKAISTVYDLIENGVDSQPTIRPVLDLSNIESGAGMIGSMFGNPSLAVATNLGAISKGMSGRGQNGNEEIISAINKLRNGLDNVGNTTYQVNGVTYDDGSEVSDAVRTLIRAAKVERRK